MDDVLIVGGGLAGSLTAWRLSIVRPQLRICLIENGDRLGGCHTWSFHDTDLPTDAQRWLEPLVVARWQHHEVRFPAARRVLSGIYASITSERLHQVIAPVLADRLRLETRATEVTPTSVTLASGEVMHARLVIDARGAAPIAAPLGWQTFLGQDLELDQDHGLRWPLLMDATVPQAGGFRFMYLLPWSARRVLVEDTVYADHAGIAEEDSRRRIDDYVGQRGWRVKQVQREERGALPIPLAGSTDAFWPDRLVRIGVRAGLFHPTTGYSLPDSAATADLIAHLDVTNVDAVYQSVRESARHAWQQRGFYRFLNRLLFRATEPELRWRVLAQFYRRPEPLIARFYSGCITWLDRCRLLSGKPPVPVMRALAQVREGHP